MDKLRPFYLIYFYGNQWKLRQIITEMKSFQICHTKKPIRYLMGLEMNKNKLIRKENPQKKIL